MIGDTPDSDVQGANNAGWVSILVKTGLFKGENSKEYPAQYVVENLEEAVKLIFQIEGIKKSL